MSMTRRGVGTLLASAALVGNGAATAQGAEHRIWADENARNIASGELFRAIVKEVYGDDVEFFAAHHLIFKKGNDVQEFPSSDMLIFDHDVAEVIWGTGFKDVLAKLAVEPIATRNALLGQLYHAR